MKQEGLRAKFILWEGVRTGLVGGGRREVGSA